MADLPDIAHASGLPYRLGVGIVMFNKDGLVFMGERTEDVPHPWQFPQGGIDPGEDMWAAACRELREETGTDHVEKLAETMAWLSYDFPPGATGHPIYGRHAGQKQKWFAVRFLGHDAEIDLNAHDTPEFGRWQWIDLSEAPKLIVDFKRPLYDAIVKEFANLISQ